MKHTAILSRILDDKEENRIKYRVVDEDEAAKLLVTNYNQALNAYARGIRIFRGDDDLSAKSSNIYLGIPGTRISNNTDNYYTKLMSDVLDSWSSYPKRNKSFICTTSKYRSKAYSEQYFGVFPKNEAKIGLCSAEDLWKSFKLLSSHVMNIDTMRDFNYDFITFLVDLTEYIYKNVNNELTIPDFNTSSRSVILDFFEKFDFEMQSLLQIPECAEDIHKWNNLVPVNWKFKEKWIEYIESGKGSYTFLNKLLNPGYNHFELSSMAEMNKYYDTSYEMYNREVWTDSECLFIRGVEENQSVIDKAVRLLK